MSHCLRLTWKQVGGVKSELQERLRQYLSSADNAPSSASVDTEESSSSPAVAAATEAEEEEEAAAEAAAVAIESDGEEEEGAFAAVTQVSDEWGDGDEEEGDVPSAVVGGRKVQAERGGGGRGGDAAR